MPKKAIITLELVPESTQTPDTQIEKEILKDAKIPWSAKISKIAISSDNAVIFQKLPNME